MTEAQTLLDLVLDDARASSINVAIYESPGQYKTQTVLDLRNRALRRLAALREAGLVAGDELLIPAIDQGIFLETLWASMLGGFIPMPIAPPTNDATRTKILDIAKSRHGARIILEADAAERLAGAAAGGGLQLSQRILEPKLASAPAEPVERRAEDIAFIQYSSGSTRAPKGIIMRHGQALANLEAMRIGLGLNATDSTLSWMPLSHDMGLAGFHLTPLYAGINQSIMPTAAFARTPLAWLQDATALGATTLASPNFGLRHTLNAIKHRGIPEDVDLSAVRYLLNGAEPISVELSERFLEALAPVGLSPTSMLPVYGLAEATLAVTFPAVGDRIRGRSLDRGSLGIGDAVRDVAPGKNALLTCYCGVPLPGLEVRIVGADGAALEADRVGRIWIRGKSVTEGYYEDPTATSEAIQGEGWLDTGDLGFQDAERGLFITGRAKDLIIVAGQNYYPHDLEQSLSKALELGDLRVAVASVIRNGQPEQVVAFVQFRGAPGDFEPTAKQVQAHLSQAFGIGDAIVCPVQQIPRTTSGKTQRRALAERLQAGEFDAVLADLNPVEITPERAPGEPVAASSTDTGAFDSSPAALEAMMTEFCGQVLDGVRFGKADNLFEQGMSSIDLAEIHGLIEARFPKGLDIRDFFDSPTIEGLAVILSERVRSGATVPVGASHG